MICNSHEFNLHYTIMYYWVIKYVMNFWILQSSLSGVADMNRKLSSLEALFCYDKAVPEEIIEKPVGLSLGEKNIGDKRRCPGCEAKGAILCATCSGSGLYIDSIMESQGIIVKVRCLGKLLFLRLSLN